MPARHLVKVESKIDLKQNKFFIIDFKTNEKISIYLSKDDECELLDKMVNNYIYQNAQLSNANYEF